MRLVREEHELTDIDMAGLVERLRNRHPLIGIAPLALMGEAADAIERLVKERERWAKDAQTTCTTLRRDCQEQIRIARSWRHNLKSPLRIGGEEMTPEERAAKIWCEPKHAHKEMDVEFAESIAVALADARAAALEEAARVADGWDMNTPDAVHIAAAIRALKEKTDG